MRRLDTRDARGAHQGPPRAFSGSTIIFIIITTITTRIIIIIVIIIIITTTTTTTITIICTLEGNRAKLDRLAFSNLPNRDLA